MQDLYWVLTEFQHSDECLELRAELCITAEDNPELCGQLHDAMAQDGLCGEEN